MSFEIPGTLSTTGRKVRVRVQTDSLQDAIERVTLRGLVVDPAFLAKTALDPSGGDSSGTIFHPEIQHPQDSQADACDTFEVEIKSQKARTGSLSHPDVQSSTDDHSNREKIMPTSSTTSTSITNLRVIPILVGVGVIVLFAIFQGTSKPKNVSITDTVSRSKASAPNPPTPTPVVPQKSEAELRQIKIAAATLEACQEMLRIERDILNSFPTYGKECAKAFVKHYPTIPMDQVDADLMEWVQEVTQAARSVLDLEQQKIVQLNHLEKNRDANAVASGLKFGERAASNGENTSDQIGYGILGALLGGAGSILETEVEMEQTKNRYDLKISEAIHALKNLHEQQNALIAKLKSRYGWMPK